MNHQRVIETTGETWTVSVDKCSDFFNDAVEAKKVETFTSKGLRQRMKYTPLWNTFMYNEHNKGKTPAPGIVEQGIAFPDCDVAGLE